MTTPKERDLERQRERLVAALRDLYEYAASLEVMAGAQSPSDVERPIMRHTLRVLEDCR
jgi:hypothetical protein